MTDLLKGRSALITGASRGLGRAIAEAFAREGADLVLSARVAAPLEAACAQIRETAGGERRVLGRVADLARPDAADGLAAFALKAFPELDILVSNAGVYGPMGPIERTDPGAWAAAVSVNLLAPARLYRAMLPGFKARRRGKIVQLSGGGATGPLPNFSAYAASKAAVVRLVETVAEEARAFGVDINAIAPGALNTRMLDEVLEAGPDRVGSAFYERAARQQREGGAPLDAAAGLAVYLASSLSDGLTGKLISAVWDPWREFGARRRELAETDVYTLRRIVPRDRGMDWGEARSGERP